MKHVLTVTILSLTATSAAFADVTIRSVTDGRFLGFERKSPSTTYIKGNKMRSEMNLGKHVHTAIFDLDAQKTYFFDTRKDKVEMWDMAAFANELNSVVDTASMTTSFAPNAQTKQIGDQTASGHDVAMSVPYVTGGAGGPRMQLNMTGVAWVVKDAPGTADYARFYLAAAEKGWVFTQPVAAKAQPGQARATAEMYRQIAALGGIPYELSMDMEIKAGDVGMNPIALLGGLLGRSGGGPMTTVVESVETGALADDLFTPPAGHKLVTMN